ncbi:feruloyl-CoA synthase [Ramlibacter monticola]|uniref:Feruloyl-CoA synthase n=1 Tax=Ramlibacter monticola TaxID=1926872 RepID=A0A936YZM6_9BURK|nr:feruloyl-CoA synthase [Ramlibacter monticola]MBL0390895.1 feruloyl-CoA synthase [Ramlibacter monticola]
MRNAPFGDGQALAPPEVVRESRADGSFVLRHPSPLQPYARCVGDWLEHWAATTPDALFLAERDAADAWRKLTYHEVRDRVGRIAQGLLDAQLPPRRPVVILSDNAIEAALLGLAAMHVGRPFCTVSSAYCRLTTDYTRIAGILDMLQPALVYAADARVYGPAVRHWGGKCTLVFGAHAQEVPGARPFAALTEAGESEAVAAAFAAIRPEHHAKYLLTSGSTGQPKVVVNSHRMLCANQQMMTQAWPFLARHRLVLLDWLPWSHTFGGNHNFHMVLAHGGALYIDEGRPAPGLVEKTLRNLREVRPNFHFNVPRGFDMLLPFLEADEACAREVLGSLEGVFYAGAALPQSIWSRLEAVAARVRDRPLWFTSSWGATETAPAITTVHWRIDRAGCLGLPLPGAELKFVPNGEKLELRARGLNVFPGYLDRQDLTDAAFDDEGYYRIGDAGRLVDPADIAQGVAFDGRVAEDFKLTTGTWVSVGTLRPRLVTALAPHVADVVVTGHEQAEVGLLVFPTPQAKALPEAALAAHVRSVLQSLRDEGAGSAQTPTRALLQAEPPSADAGEITDKGYLNQRAVLSRRAADVAALYAGEDPRVIRA